MKRAIFFTEILILVGLASGGETNVEIIVGKWQEITGPKTMEFFKEGTIIFVDDDGKQMVGDYRRLDDTRLRIDLGGLGELIGPMISKIAPSASEIIFTNPVSERLEVYRKVRVLRGEKEKALDKTKRTEVKSPGKEAGLLGKYFGKRSDGWPVFVELKSDGTGLVSYTQILCWEVIWSPRENPPYSPTLMLMFSLLTGDSMGLDYHASDGKRAIKIPLHFDSYRVDHWHRRVMNSQELLARQPGANLINLGKVRPWDSDKSTTCPGEVQIWNRYFFKAGDQELIRELKRIPNFRPPGCRRTIGYDGSAVFYSTFNWEISGNQINTIVDGKIQGELEIKIDTLIDKKHGITFTKQNDNFEFLTFAHTLIQSGALTQGESVAQSTTKRKPSAKLSTVNSGKGTINGSNKSQNIGEGLKALDIKLPRPMFVGVPGYSRTAKFIQNLEKPLGRRPPFFAPIGISNVALNKPVTASDDKPITGSLNMITDGNKEAPYYVELGPSVQSITIDLGERYQLYAILIWHYHKLPRVYFDVVAQVYAPDSITSVKTVFNNDIDNSIGLGIGTDMHYFETNKGKLIDVGGVKGQYVRLYSNGNTSNNLNHYVEVEVYGRPLTVADEQRADYSIETIHGLLAENIHLKQTITNLKREEQIGYAKVINQQTIDGQTRTTLKFVETAPDNKLKTILEREYTIAGDKIRFDVLIVKFGNKMVIDGKTRALYLWRRVYGDKMVPDEGFVIEQQGTQPQRYSNLLEGLPIEQRQIFWSNIWDLANDTKKLKEYDIEAVNVNVVHSRLRKGLIYVFKISPTGKVYLEPIPDI